MTNHATTADTDINVNTDVNSPEASCHSHSMSDYLAHQSRKSHSFFEGRDEWQSMAKALKNSRESLEQAITTAHLAQMDDFDMPTLVVDIHSGAKLSRHWDGH